MGPALNAVDRCSLRWPAGSIPSSIDFLISSNPRVVARGLHWLAIGLATSFIAWVLGMMMTQAMFDLEQDYLAEAIQPGWFRSLITLGTWLLLLSPLLALAGGSRPDHAWPTSSAGQRTQGLEHHRVVGLRPAALVHLDGVAELDFARRRAAPVDPRHLGHGPAWSVEYRRGVVDAGATAGWLVAVVRHPIVAGVNLGGSRTFRTATTKRQYVVDLVWATLFWSGGILLQYGGGGLGVSLPVTVGSILRLVSGGFVLVGVVYLWVNLGWIAEAAVGHRLLDSKPAWTDPGGSVAAASSAGIGPSTSNQ